MAKARRRGRRPLPDPGRARPVGREHWREDGRRRPGSPPRRTPTGGPCRCGSKKGPIFTPTGARTAGTGTWAPVAPDRPAGISARTIPSRRYSTAWPKPTAPARSDKAGAKRPDTKGRIIAAAEEVVLRDGVAHLTLEATAAEAGLSKGGVLYHFPTRDALVLGMVGKIIGEFDHDIEAEMATLQGPGRFTRAYIRATMMPTSPPPTMRTDSGPLSSPPPPPNLPFSPLCRRPPIAGKPGWWTTGWTRSPPPCSVGLRRALALRPVRIGATARRPPWVGRGRARTPGHPVPMIDDPIHDRQPRQGRRRRLEAVGDDFVGRHLPAMDGSQRPGAHAARLHPPPRWV